MKPTRSKFIRTFHKDYVREKYGRSKSSYFGGLYDDCAKQDNKCYYCNREMTFKLGEHNTATREHIIPKCMGGKGKQNYVAACHRCNHTQGKNFHNMYMRRVNHAIF